MQMTTRNRLPDVGHAIRDAREDRGLSQEELAGLAGVSPTTVRTYEIEGALPGAKLRSLMRALGWPHDAVERIADGDRSFIWSRDPAADDPVVVLSGDWERMSPESRERLKAIARTFAEQDDT